MLRSVVSAFRTRKQIWVVFAYGAVYMMLFDLAERMHRNLGTFHMIICPMDKYIPFCEFFVVFYISWFVYMFLAYGFAIAINKNVAEFNRFVLYLCTGMTVFLFVSFVFPNGLDIRPAVMPRDNIFTRLVTFVYSKDTPTNVFPSIHCFNSVAIYLAAKDCHSFRNYPWVKRVCFVWTVLIILSTMFIKQHSAYDVLAGIGMALALYEVIYQPYRQVAGKPAKEKAAARTH